MTCIYLFFTFYVSDTGVSVARAYGEYPVYQNKMDIIKGCDIVCCTAGRFKHAVDEKWLLLDDVQIIVFDEGDNLLEGGHLTEVGAMLKDFKVWLSHFFERF